MSTGVPPLSGPPKPQAKGLNCPKCGAAIVLRSFGPGRTNAARWLRRTWGNLDPSLAASVVRKVVERPCSSPALETAEISQLKVVELHKLAEIQSRLGIAVIERSEFPGF